MQSSLWECLGNMGQSTYALKEDNFRIGKNEHNIIRLVAANEKTLMMKKVVKYCSMLTLVKQPTTQLLILSDLIASERSKTVIHHTPNHWAHCAMMFENMNVQWNCALFLSSSHRSSRVHICKTRKNITSQKCIHI